MKRSLPVRNLRDLLGESDIGLEGRVVADDHLNTRMWLRLLACSTQIENQIREQLRVNFDISLARFDYMAQLYRRPEGLRVRVLTRYLMVSGGNVTSLTKGLVKSGIVERVPDANDQRSYWVRLTPEGRKKFSAMAKKHEGWLKSLFSDVPADIKETLYSTLGYLRAHLAGP